MKKNLLAILLAGLLLLSAAACKKNDETPDDTDGIDTNEVTTEDSYIDVETDTDGNPVTNADPETKEPETNAAYDPSEKNPTFTDTTLEVVVVSSVANVRTSTELLESNIVGWPKEGRTLTVTGVSENWYRINYTVSGEEQTCYIAKSVAADISVLDDFTEIEGGEEVEVTADSLNVRSYPSADFDVAVRATLAKGTKVTRIAVSENWSRILFELTSETETGEDGKPVTETKEYYIRNTYIKTTAAETEATTEETTEAATEATTEASTETQAAQ